MGGRLRRAVADRLRDAGRARQSIYLDKALQVVNEDSRQKIVSRRVLTPKGRDRGRRRRTRRRAGHDPQRFPRARVLARIGRHRRRRATRSTDVTLPESLTTYRIMAVAGDKASRFGWAQNEIRINKPVLLTPTWPRFLAVGDKALLRRRRPHRSSSRPGKATVTIKSLDPSVVEFSGSRRSSDDRRRAAEGTAEVRFNAAAKAVGNARIQMTRVAQRRERRVRRRAAGAHPRADGNRRRVRRSETDARRKRSTFRRMSCPRPADCTSSFRRRRWSASPKARSISSTIRTAARSSAPPRPWRSCSPPTSATPSRCRASMRRRRTRRRRRPSTSCTSSSAATAASPSGPGECSGEVAVPHRERAARHAARARS